MKQREREREKERKRTEGRKKQNKRKKKEMRSLMICIWQEEQSPTLKMSGKDREFSLHLLFCSIQLDDAHPNCFTQSTGFKC